MKVAHLELGRVIAPAKLRRAGDGDFPVLSMTMRDGLVDQADKFKKRVASADTSPYKVVERNQLVVGFPIDEGVLAFQNLYDEAIVSPAYDVWNLQDSSSVDSRYLQRFLRSPIALTFYSAKLRGTTARRRTLPDDIFLSLRVPLPPLAEQRRIAEVLDRAEALRAKRRAALAELDSLTQSLFLDLFGDPMMNPKGWKTCLLEDIAYKITDGTHKTPNYTECGIEFLSAKDLKEGGIAWGTGKYISEEEHRDLIKRCNPELGDILLAKSGSLGNVAIIDRSHQFSLFESLCLIKHDRQRIEGQFLTGLLRSPSMLAHLLGKNKGVAIKHLHLVDVRNLRIPLPPIALQQEFARLVRAVEKLKQAQRTALAEQDALFATLQYRAFRGEL